MSSLLRKPILSIQWEWNTPLHGYVFYDVEEFKAWLRREAVDFHNNYMCEPGECGSWINNVRPITDISFRGAVRVMVREAKEADPWITWHRLDDGRIDLEW